MTKTFVIECQKLDDHNARGFITESQKAHPFDAVLKRFPTHEHARRWLVQNNDSLREGWLHIIREGLIKLWLLVTC